MSQTLCKGSLTCDPPTLKGIPIYRGGSEAGGGQAQGHRVGRTYSWDSSPGHLNSKPTLFIAQNTSLLRSVLTCHSNRAGSPFFNIWLPTITRYKEKAKATSTNRSQNVDSYDYLRLPSIFYQKKHLYICIYKHLYRYIHIHSWSTHKHTGTYTYLHTHRVDTSPIWNSAIQRPHLSGTQPRTRK